MDAPTRFGISRRVRWVCCLLNQAVVLPLGPTLTVTRPLLGSAGEHIVEPFWQQRHHQGAQHSKNIKKLTFCKSSMSQNSRNVYFLETKSPCGVAPNIDEGLRMHPHKINSFIQKSGKVGFLQKSRIWWKFTHQNSLFTENLNGPYGPYEQLLLDISPNKWPKNQVLDEKWLLRENDHAPY